MKLLFVWSGSDVLKQWGSGYAIAYTDTLENARRMVQQQIYDYYSWVDPTIPDDLDYLNEKTAFLNRTPDIYADDFAIAIQGSE